jgi:hypothetical protein
LGLTDSVRRTMSERALCLESGDSGRQGDPTVLVIQDARVQYMRDATRSSLLASSSGFLRRSHARTIRRTAAPRTPCGPAQILDPRGPRARPTPSLRSLSESSFLLLRHISVCSYTYHTSL